MADRKQPASKSGIVLRLGAAAAAKFGLGASAKAAAVAEKPLRQATMRRQPAAANEKLPHRRPGTDVNLT
jgi:hypothetical protein